MLVLGTALILRVIVADLNPVPSGGAQRSVAQRSAAD